MFHFPVMSHVTWPTCHEKQYATALLESSSLTWNWWKWRYFKPIQSVIRVGIDICFGVIFTSRKLVSESWEQSKGWQWCWWHRYIGDFMMVTDFRCWWQNHYVGDFFLYVGDFLNVLNRSPTPQTCHQHIWSPTSVTNIDVTKWLTPNVRVGSNPSWRRKR